MKRKYGSQKTSLTLCPLAKKVYDETDPLNIYEEESGLYTITGVLEYDHLTERQVNEILIEYGPSEENAMKKFVKLKKGFLLIEESCDPNYPGVYVSWVDKKTDIAQTLCLVEDNEDDPESVKLHVWGCSDIDEPTGTYTIRKANWEGMGE